MVSSDACQNLAARLQSQGLSSVEANLAQALLRLHWVVVPRGLFSLAGRNMFFERFLRSPVPVWRQSLRRSFLEFLLRAKLP